MYMNNTSCCSHAGKPQHVSSCCKDEGSSACCGERSATKSSVIDPVCKMELDPSETKLTAEYKGEIYYFCNVTCKESFISDPEKCLSEVTR